MAGVYLIVDLRSGDQYVGPAYGDRGILGRWEYHDRTGHGGSARLQALLADDPAQARAFQFTILRTLPLSMAQREVAVVETAFNWKLGSRAFGRNAN